MEILDIKVGKRYLVLIESEKFGNVLLEGEASYVGGSSEIKLRDLEFIRNNSQDLVISDDKKQWKFDKKIFGNSKFSSTLGTTNETIYPLDRLDTLLLIMEVM